LNGCCAKENCKTKAEINSKKKRRKKIGDEPLDKGEWEK
jgi:hypothetical protein